MEMVKSNILESEINIKPEKNTKQPTYRKVMKGLRYLAVVILLINFAGSVINLVLGNYYEFAIHISIILLFVSFYYVYEATLSREKFEFSILETASITSLADNYDMVFYIDVPSNTIIQYHCDVPFSDFFNTSNNKIPPAKFDEVLNRLVYSEDYDMFRKLTERSFVMQKIQKDGSYNADFRLLLFGKPVWYRIRFVLDNSRNGGVLTGIKNINDEKVGSVALRKQESVFRHCLDTFQNSSNLDEAVNKTLEIIAKFYEADRAYIFEFNKEGTLMSNTYEYCRSGVTPEMKNLQDLDVNICDRWIKAFEEEGAYFFNSLSREVDNDSSAYKILEPQGIDSLIAAPIRTDGRIVGFFGVDNPNCDTDEKFLVRAISAVLYNETSNRKKLIREQYVSSVLFNDYLAVYYVDLKNDTMEGFKYDPDMKSRYSDGESYYSTIRKFVENSVNVHDIPKMREIVEPEYIRRKLLEKGRFSVSFEDTGHDKNTIIEMNFIKVTDDGTNLVITVLDKTKEKERENGWSQKDIEYKVQLTRLKRKEITLKQALIRCCSGYMDVNLSKNRIIGNVMSKSVSGQPETWAINSPELRPDFTYDDFEKWWSKKYILSDKDEYYNMVCTEHLLNCFEAGQMSVEYKADSIVDGHKVKGNIYFYMSREVETGDVMALITVKNI